MRALVTGAAGFIGSHLAERLLVQGAEVIGIDAFTDTRPRDVGLANLADLSRDPDFTLIESRIQDANLPALLHGVTHVFHLAARSRVAGSWGANFAHSLDDNVRATQVLLEACTDTELQHFVYASSASVYGDDVAIPMQEQQVPRPVSPYGATKLAAESLCQLYYVNYGVPTVSLRYFCVYGPRQRPDMALNRFLRAATAFEPVTVCGDGEQTRDFTFVGDAVSATIAAGTMGVPGRVYNIGGGTRVTVNHVLNVIARLLGHPMEVRRVERQPGEMRHAWADISEARRDLAYLPSMTLEEGLAAQLRWVREGT
jgi:UDP-glucose 4-epimerase